MKLLKKRLIKLKWFLYRWQRMVHPQEEVYRIKQFLQTNIVDRYDQKRHYTFEALQTGFVFINENLAKTYPVDLAVSYGVFQKQVLLNDYRWRTDPKSQTTSPIVFKGNINQKDITIAGENRYVYELNRLHVLPALAIAAGNGCKDCLQQTEAIINSWIQQNPYLKSINWKSGIEAGIRSVNLVIVRLLLKNTEDANNVKREIDLLLAYHYTYLKKHLSLFSSANNHLLKELLGFIVISAVYKFKDHEKDLSFYFSYYQNEILKQTYADGGSKEQSVHYHAAVLNASLLVLHFASAAGLQPAKAFVERLKNMCVFLDEMTLGGKTESLFGDKDDSNIVYDVFDKQFNLYHSLLTTGKRIFTDIIYSYYKGSHNDFINCLLYNNLHYPKAKVIAVDKESFTYFPQSGYFIFDALPASSRLYFDVGELGFGPVAAHGHSDLLHFTLWVDGEPFIVDSGTYQYNPHYKKWREYFRGASAHNTIAVNQQSHSKSLGVMLWGKLPIINVTGYGEDENNDPFCTAEHNAFTNSNVVHRRKIKRRQNALFIEDKLMGKGTYQFDFYLHFHPSVVPSLSANELLLTNGKKQLKVINSMFNQAKLEHGNESLPLGWYSDKFDTMVKTYSLRLSANAVNNLDIKTEIIFVE